jgi:GxxExxY protein
VTYDLDRLVLNDNHGAGGCHGHCPNPIDHPAAGKSCGYNWRDDSPHRTRPRFTRKHLYRVLAIRTEAGRIPLCYPGRSSVVYRGVKLELGYRMDLVVEDLVVVEVKSVEAISPVHQAQILSYLKLSGKSIGLLINFNVVHLRDGIKRFVNGTGWK